MRFAFVSSCEMCCVSIAAMCLHSSPMRENHASSMPWLSSVLISSVIVSNRLSSRFSMRSLICGLLCLMPIMV